MSTISKLSPITRTIFLKTTKPKLFCVRKCLNSNFYNIVGIFFLAPFIALDELETAFFMKDQLIIAFNTKLTNKRVYFSNSSICHVIVGNQMNLSSKCSQQNGNSKLILFHQSQFKLHSYPGLALNDSKNMYVKFLLEIKQKEKVKTLDSKAKKSQDQRFGP